MSRPIKENSERAGELMLQCRLLALANSLVRLRGWWLHHSALKLTRQRASQWVAPVPTVAGLTHAKLRKNRLESCGMSLIEGWIIGNELLLAWLVVSSPFAVLVGLFIKSGSWK
jgi:hypothetical protein